MSDTFENVLVLSVGDAHELAPEVLNNPSERVLLKSIYKAVIENNDIFGDYADYHNLAATYAKVDDYKSAYEIAVKGLNQYPFDIDLLADAVNYGSKCNKIQKCEEYIEVLLSRPFVFWNWRSFTFVIDYYMASLSWVEPEHIQAAFDMAINMAKKYQETLPNEERGYVAEAEIHLKKADFVSAEEVLRKAIFGVESLIAPQCCLKYVDILSEKGDYQNVIEVAKKGIASTAQDQPTARTGYFSYLSALAKDALLHQDQDFNNQDRVLNIYSDYKIADSLLVNTPAYIFNIHIRTHILSIKTGIPYDSESSADK